MSDADALKAEGNSLYARGKYGAAIEAYTNAIMSKSDDEKLFTNRALCHLKKESWDSALLDGTRAIEINAKFVKGHYCSGLAYYHLKRWDEAVAALDTCIRLSENQSTPFTAEIEELLLAARKEVWNREADENIAKTHEVHLLVKRLLNEQAGQGADMAKALEVVDDVFGAYEDKYKAGKVPEHYTCAISLDLLRDPVITASGHTYERSLLLTHYDKNGEFDPQTRQPCKKKDVIPNVAMRHAVQAYLKENPWAHQH